MALGNYVGISVREAMERINSISNGWYLPIIQRQYVWGSRESSEEYICLLLDSLLRGYPIGGLVLWETDTEIPYREFLKDYNAGEVTRAVPEGRWRGHKFLVYDGQQRLQTLYSVIYYRFNGRKLFFNLLFEQNEKEIDETGFYFKSSGQPTGQFELEISKLVATKEKTDLIREYVLNGNFTTQQQNTVISNLDNLWSVFVETDRKSIAYFPVSSDTPQEVNEVFRRLNTGGIALTQLEMVLAKIKQHYPYFEEQLWDLSHELARATGNTPGVSLTAHEIVQLLYLLIFNTTRVDESKVSKDKDASTKFYKTLESVKVVLPNFFKMFFFEGLHINARWLIIRQQAILPMLAYCVTLFQSGIKNWKIEQLNIKPLLTYFIKSQLCDWNTQTMVTSFSRIAILKAQNGEDFPVDEITKIAREKNRTGEVSFCQFLAQLWFSLKILTPSRIYLFNERTPQIDHIFPKELKNGQSNTEGYKERVDVLWNMQPTPAGVNRQKWFSHPVEYFKSEKGRAFLADYDFLPQNLDSLEWQNENTFIDFRKGKMLEFLKNRYDIELKENAE